MNLIYWIIGILLIIILLPQVILTFIFMDVIVESSIEHNKDKDKGKLDDIVYSCVKGDYNITHGWLNFTYIDYKNKTTSLEWWINDSNGNIISYINSNDIKNKFIYNTIVPLDYSYNIHLSAVHPDLPCLK